MTRFLSCILLPLVLLQGDALAAADRLNERLARFSLATGEPAMALRWVAADPSSEAEILRGMAYWNLGLVEQTAEVLGKVADKGESLDPGAALVLAKANRAIGQTDVANRLLEDLRHSGKQDEAQEASFLLAQQAIEISAYDRAGQVLAHAPEGYWAALGYLNLATAYALQDTDTARSLIALRVAQAMLGERATTAYPDLLQRIQLTAGFVALKGEDPDKALSFLNKVSLKGYYTPRALYLHGLAHARKDNYRAAMQSWHRARKFPLGFPGAADAWLGMGRGFDEAGYLGQAGEAYLGAIAAFEGELVTLATLKQQIRQQGSYDAVVRSARAEDVEWFLAESKTLTQPRLAYLMHFMESADAQNAVVRVAELDQMAQRLRSRKQELHVFGRMLNQRRDSLRRHTGVGDLDVIGAHIATLKARRQDLEGTLRSMAQAGRSAELASGELARKLEQVRSLQAKNNLTPEEFERLERLQGVLAWQAQEQFDLARRDHERELTRIGKALDAAEQSYGRFEDQLHEAPERFEGLIDRVDQLAVEADRQLDRIESLRQRSEKTLDSALLHFLDRQSAVMSGHLDRSEQQIAHLYEYLALNRAVDTAAGGDE
ncbi:hypothetical protein RE428_26700 [Marinobacter nanhaiticus D15-8W]|uniref:Tetratricopeptide repeat protein n=1 Tax=Marinobacter nanhaiticus D15-8W TaxID=626887 RepID=N6VVR5_9GAMM|nr:hypothetical protein [Marinobacter nanhaiticus]ENO14265.1 hypothetical protein J057_22765 [Marinobacter nanhaiticus D15-8W]BES71652.1 hypothetical protein RE428_26700 [Marinobacter nanhaiticus D15-8W]